MKKIIILIILLSITSISYADENLQNFYLNLPNISNNIQNFNFTIGTVDSIDTYNVPKKYLLDEKFDDSKVNKMYLIKISDYKIFSDLDINKFFENKDLYLYIQPGDINFNINDYKIGDKIIFRSDIPLFNDSFYSNTIYSKSILDLFYNDKNNYIKYEQGIGYFKCLSNNNYEIKNISPKSEELFYSSLAFINPQSFTGNISEISLYEKNIVLDNINKSGVCNTNDNIYQPISKDNKLVLNNVNEKSKNNYIFYFLGIITLLLIVYYTKNIKKN